MSKTVIHDFRILNNNYLLDQSSAYTPYLFKFNSKEISFASKLLNFKEINKDSIEETIKEYISITSNFDPVSQNKCLLYITIDSDYNEVEFFKILFLLQQIKRNDIIILSDKTAFSLISEGMNIIYLSDCFSGKGIGLLPLSESKVSTKGLKWNLDQSITKVGGDMVSTSNQVESNINNTIEIYLEYGCLIISFELTL